MFAKDTNEGERRTAKGEWDTDSPSPLTHSPNPLAPCMNAKKDSLSYYFALAALIRQFGEGGLKPI